MRHVLLLIILVTASPAAAQCRNPFCWNPQCQRLRWQQRQKPAAAPAPETAANTTPPAATVPATTPSALSPPPSALIDTVAQVATDAAPMAAAATSLIDSPWFTAAVGASTGGTGIAAIWAARALLGLRRRRREGDTAAAGSFPERLPRDDTEARQVLQLRQLEGRDPVLDGFVGVALQDQLREDSRNGQLTDDGRQYAAALMDRVRDQVDDVAPIATDRLYRGAWRQTT